MNCHQWKPLDSVLHPIQRCERCKAYAYFIQNEYHRGVKSVTHQIHDVIIYDFIDIGTCDEEIVRLVLES